MKKHTEDCLDANDDTSVLKGKCICPKPQHTPTPWEIEEREGQVFIEVEQNADENQWIIAKCFGPKADDNAAFIVKAVNCHKELLSALRHLQFLSCNKYDDATWRKAWISASNAISKAEDK